MVKCLWSLTFFFHTWWKCCLSAFGAHVNQCGCGRQCTPQRKPFEAMVAVGLTGAHPRFNALQHCHILCNFRLKIYLCSPKNARQRSNSYFHMGKEALVDMNHSLHKFGAFVYFTYCSLSLSWRLSIFLPEPHFLARYILSRQGTYSSRGALKVPRRSLLLVQWNSSYTWTLQSTKQCNLIVAVDVERNSG